MRDIYLYEDCDVLKNLLNIKDKEMLDEAEEYVRTALVAYNAVFDDMGDISKPEYLIKIVEDAIIRGNRF